MMLWSARVVGSLTILGGACMAASADDATTEDRLPNGDFEADGGWFASFRDGAEGTWEWDASVARSGGRSLRLTKTNSVGHIVVRPTVAPKLSQGERYVLSGRFRSEDAPLTALLLFRLGEPDAENFLNPYGLYDCPTHAHIPNCPPGHWEKRVLTFVCTDAPNPDPNFARNYPPGSYPHIILYGNPCTVWLDDLDVAAPRSGARQDRETYTLPYSEAEALEIISKREPVSLTVESRRGQSVLVENGKPVPAVFHLASENNELVGDFHSFGEAGVRLAICPVPLPSVWKGKGRLDLAKVDDWAMQALRKDPNARLLLHFHVYPYDEWGAENPEECWTNAEGLCGYGWGGRIAGYAKPSDEASGGDPRVFIPSYHSQVWRDESCEAIRAIVRHVKQQPYAAAVGGFYYFGGDDGRLQPGPRDCSRGALEGFRDWCRRTYGTPEILSETWGAELADFDAVQIPDDSGAVVFSGVPGRLDPYTLNPQVNDYRAYHIADAWDLCDAWAGAAKGEWDRPSIAGIYRDLEEDFLRLRNVDMCGNDSFYPYRRPGYASAGWYPVRTDAHRKLWCMDLDLRSYAGPQVHDEEYEQWIGAALTPEAWSATHDKLTGLCLAKGAGFWYYDMLAYFQDEAIMRGIRETKTVADGLVTRPAKRFRPDVAVVIKGHARDWHSVYHNVVTGHIGEWGFNYLQGMMLGTSGVPFDMVYLSDVLEQPALQDYKVFVFLQLPYLSLAERNAIDKKLKRGGRTLVWVHDTGYLSERGKDTAGMSELIGIQVQTDERFERLTPLLTDGNHPYTRGALPFQGGAETMYVGHRLQGNDTGTAPPQPFWVDDPSAEAFCQYREGGRVAMATKAYDKWTSVYLAPANSLGPDLMNNIAREAGAFVCGPPGQAVAMGGNFVSIHGMRGGQYHLSLPPGTRRVMDARTGAVLHEGGGECELTIEAQRTYWLLLE